MKKYYTILKLMQWYPDWVLLTFVNKKGPLQCINLRAAENEALQQLASLMLKKQERMKSLWKKTYLMEFCLSTSLNVLYF